MNLQPVNTNILDSIFSNIEEMGRSIGNTMVERAKWLREIRQDELERQEKLAEKEATKKEEAGKYKLYSDLIRSKEEQITPGKPWSELTSKQPERPLFGPFNEKRAQGLNLLPQDVFAKTPAMEQFFNASSLRQAKYGSPIYEGQLRQLKLVYESGGDVEKAYNDIINMEKDVAQKQTKRKEEAEKTAKIKSDEAENRALLDVANENPQNYTEISLKEANKTKNPIHLVHKTIKSDEGLSDWAKTQKSAILKNLEDHKQEIFNMRHYDSFTGGYIYLPILGEKINYDETEFQKLIHTINQEIYKVSSMTDENEIKKYEEEKNGDYRIFKLDEPDKLNYDSMIRERDRMIQDNKIPLSNIKEYNSAMLEINKQIFNKYGPPDIIELMSKEGDELIKYFKDNYKLDYDLEKASIAKNKLIHDEFINFNKQFQEE